MQLTTLFLCLMTMAPVVVQAAPIPSNDLSLDLVKRVATPAKPAAKPAPVAAKPVAAPAKPPAKPAPAPAKPPAKPAPVPAKPVPAPAKPVPAPAKPPTAKPPPAAPVKNPPTSPTTGGSSKPGQGTTPPGGDADVCSILSKRGTPTPCSCFRKCNQCTEQATCAFSTATFKCEDRVNNLPADSLVGPAAKTANPRCVAVNQQAAIFPLIPGKTGKDATPQNAEVPAGKPTPEIQAAFNQIRAHIFTLDNNDPQRRDSGQHLRSVWLQNHPTGPKSIENCNTSTGLCSFINGSKTLWNDAAGFYSQRDVENMCSIALELTSNGANKHIVLSPLNKKICIQATKRSSTFNAATGQGQGSCFPTSINEATGNVHAAC